MFRLPSPSVFPTLTGGGTMSLKNTRNNKIHRTGLFKNTLDLTMATIIPSIIVTDTSGFSCDAYSRFYSPASIPPSSFESLHHVRTIDGHSRFCADIRLRLHLCTEPINSNDVFQFNLQRERIVFDYLKNAYVCGIHNMMADLPQAISGKDVSDISNFIRNEAARFWSRIEHMPEQLKIRSGLQFILDSPHHDIWSIDTTALEQFDKVLYEFKNSNDYFGSGYKRVHPCYRAMMRQSNGVPKTHWWWNNMTKKQRRAAIKLADETAAAKIIEIFTQIAQNHKQLSKPL